VGIGTVGRGGYRGHSSPRRCRHRRPSDKKILGGIQRQYSSAT
jgi:hypothetical protein